MRSVVPIVRREAAWWLFLVATLLACGAAYSAGATSTVLAFSTAAGICAVLVGTAGMLLVASVWGASADACAETASLMAGIPARAFRGRLFLVLLLVVVGAAVAVTLMALAPVLVHPGQKGDTAETSDVLTISLTYLAVPTALAWGTVLSWGRTKTAAVAVTVTASLLPLLAWFGPRLSGRTLVLALSPISAASVIPPGNGNSAFVSLLSGLTLSGAWVVCALILRTQAPVDEARRVERRESARGHAPALRRGARSRALWVGACVTVAAAVMSAGPTLGEYLPYGLRYSTTVQAERGIGAEATLRQFLTLYAAGRVTRADTLAATGQASDVMEHLPANFAQATHNAIMSVYASPSIRSADMEITVDRYTFHACLLHSDRTWRVRSIDEAPCRRA